MKMIFVGGGTGGHVSPNIAIIDEIKKISKEKGIDVDFLYVGRLGGLEKDLVSSKGIKYRGIFTGKLRRYFSWKNFSDIFLIALGFFQSLSILISNRPNIVFAKGGFVTVPFCLACTLLRVPFFIHESDSVMGLSNKILFSFAKKIFLGFPVDAYNKLPIKKTFFSGNPIREEILKNKISKEDFYGKYKTAKNKKIIFVVGGSQGATAINKLIADNLDDILGEFILIHACGKNNFSEFKAKRTLLDENEKRNYLLYDHIGIEMGELLSVSDLIVSRAGANSIAEIISIKKPAIIIPLSSAASDHQNKNAKFLQRNGVFIVLDENIMDGKLLFEEIKSLVYDKEKMGMMIKNMKNIFPENSARIIADHLINSK